MMLTSPSPLSHQRNATSSPGQAKTRSSTVYGCNSNCKDDTVPRPSDRILPLRECWRGRPNCTIPVMRRESGDETAPDSTNGTPGTVTATRRHHGESRVSDVTLAALLTLPVAESESFFAAASCHACSIDSGIDISHMAYSFTLFLDTLQIISPGASDIDGALLR